MSHHELLKRLEALKQESEALLQSQEACFEKQREMLNVATANNQRKGLLVTIKRVLTGDKRNHP